MRGPPPCCAVQGRSDASSIGAQMAFARQGDGCGAPPNRPRTHDDRSRFVMRSTGTFDSDRSRPAACTSVGTTSLAWCAPANADRRGGNRYLVARIQQQHPYKFGGSTRLLRGQFPVIIRMFVLIWTQCAIHAESSTHHNAQQGRFCMARPCARHSACIVGKLRVRPGRTHASIVSPFRIDSSVWAAPIRSPQIIEKRSFLLGKANAPSSVVV
jgi:hypothetical protein